MIEAEANFETALEEMFARSVIYGEGWAHLDERAGRFGIVRDMNQPRPRAKADPNRIRFVGPCGTMPDTPPRKQSVGRRHGKGAHPGDSMGDGWGGPAKGKGTAEKAAPFTPETGAAAGAAPRVQDRAALRAERTAALEDRLFALSQEAEREETSVSAARALHAIYNGTPVASVQHSGPDGGPIPTSLTVVFRKPDSI